MSAHDVEAPAEYADKKDTTSRDMSIGEGGKHFHQRVEEFSMWKDEGTFQDMEYKRRREVKKKMKGAIRSDRRLILSHRLYIPAIGLILASSFILLLSIIEGLGEETIIWRQRRLFQILGGVLLAIGIIALMAVAAYTYNREDQVRAKCGFPSLFMSSMKGETSTKNLEEFAFLQDTFVDKPRRYSGRFSRLDSVESRNSSKILGNSFSSTSTAMSWVHKHRGYTAGLARQSSIRRENSDSALDKIFARNRLLNWHVEGTATASASPSSPNAQVESCDKGDDEIIKKSDESNSNDDEIIHLSGSKDKKLVSQIESSVSMASSGYCSNTSTQCLSLNVNNKLSNNNKTENRRMLSRHLSEPSQNVAVHYIAKHARLLSEGIASEEKTFEEQQQLQQQHPIVHNLPIINVECV